MWGLAGAALAPFPAIEDLAKPAFKSLCLPRKPPGALGSTPLTCAPLGAPAGFWSSPPPPLWQPYHCKRQKYVCAQTFKADGEGCAHVLFFFNFTMVFPSFRNPQLLFLHEGELLWSLRVPVSIRDEWSGKEGPKQGTSQSALIYRQNIQIQMAAPAPTPSLT